MEEFFHKTSHATSYRSVFPANLNGAGPYQFVEEYTMDRAVGSLLESENECDKQRRTLIVDLLYNGLFRSSS